MKDKRPSKEQITAAVEATRKATDATAEHLPEKVRQSYKTAHAALAHPPGSENRRDAAVGIHAVHSDEHPLKKWFPGMHREIPRVKKSLFKGFALQGKINFQGFPISIENKKGSTRKWYDPHGKESGETKMHFDYGYIRRTKGTDGDHVDVYVGPNEDADTVYVVHQMKKPDFKKYDEDKVMMGFGTAKEAKVAYLKQYDDPKFFGSMTSIPVEEFRKKVMDKKNYGKVIKSHVWHVSVEHPDRTDEEELFSQWLHDYPIHEHESRWAKQKELDQKEKTKPHPGPHPGVEVKTHDVQGNDAGEV
jgi:hypothetical protein